MGGVSILGWVMRHRRKVMAVLLIVALWLGHYADGVDDNPACQAPSGGLAYPTVGDAKVTSGYGARQNPVTGETGEFHQGVDLAAREGSPLFAFADGVVAAAQDQGVQGFGGWIVLDHTINGVVMSTVYGHINPGGVLVKKGDQVTAGQQIGRMGNAGQSTGAHLHFEVWDGKRLGGGHHVDPQPWLDRANNASSTTSGGDTRELVEKFHLTEVQLLRARQIVSTGRERGVKDVGIVAAVAAAMTESTLMNLASEQVPESKNYPHDGVVPGDYDSVGLFQQRASIWQMPMEELMDPHQQIRWFYTQLATVDGWESMPVGAIAQAVERSAFPDRYAKNEELGRAALRAFGAGGDPGVSCGRRRGIRGGKVGERIIAAARTQKGQPYVWGGGDIHGPTSGGFDCSGLVLYSVYVATEKQLQLTHQTNSQVHDKRLDRVRWEDRQPGDLLYFGSPADYHHTAIYLGQQDGKDMMIEAQMTGVPVGEFPVRFGEEIQVRRVPEQ